MIRKKILIGSVVFNEEEKLQYLLNNFKKIQFNFPYKILFANDGSTDNSYNILKRYSNNVDKNFIVISSSTNMGVGYHLKKIIDYGIKNKFDICVIIAGNGKDNPVEIPKIIDPVIKENYDYIQGSRFLKGGSFKNLPFMRKLFIKGFTVIMWMFTGFKGTDATNGFRAYRFDLFKNQNINVN